MLQTDSSRPPKIVSLSLVFLLAGLLGCSHGSQGEQAAGTKNIPGFSNANQWATSFGGPIIKNKTFFFVDYEGMRFVLPNQFFVTSPTPQFAAAVGAQVAASNPAESATMNKLLGLWTNAPGYGGATVNPLTAGDSCSTLVFTVPTPGFTPGSTACWSARG